MKVISKLIPLLAAALYVSAYGVITDVSGANGLHGVGFGVVSTITTLDQFRQQSSIINDIEIAGGLTGICGRTLGGGVIDVQAMLAGSGLVRMKLFQPDTGGTGATGEDFAGMAIRMDILRRFGPTTTTFSLIAQIPNGVTCTGGPNENACLVRCRNAVIAGSFGGCVAVTTADSGGATGAAAETDVVFDANDAPNAMVPPSVPIAVPSTIGTSFGNTPTGASPGTICCSPARGSSPITRGSSPIIRSSRLIFRSSAPATRRGTSAGWWAPTGTRGNTTNNSRCSASWE
ncbi:hypothetical protein PLEOSDRAFT_1080249 [Pleurotus ostreatus PC15]|uniref:Uncharacterized protein n=1 Tax=Pleurotus ostreatus (strain PC15) TaxID=1137138 RepID=A0A067P0G9_PLEO1|nr:hypothetical protein PLEOSDRAFT_1080249 [Pleurotus ostreatus PC15]